MHHLNKYFEADGTPDPLVTALHRQATLVSCSQTPHSTRARKPDRIVAVAGRAFPQERPHMTPTAWLRRWNVQVRLCWADGRGMTTFTSPVSAGSVVVSADPLRLAMSAYLSRFRGISREHTCSDLNAFMTWCTERGVQPLSARRSDLELFVRWMQETRRFKPSTVARRTSVVSGFYRTCVIDGVLDHSPAE